MSACFSRLSTSEPGMDRLIYVACSGAEVDFDSIITADDTTTTVDTDAYSVDAYKPTQEV